MKNRYLTLLALPLLLAGCGSGADSNVTADEGDVVGAEVVEGTISDAMVDLDQSTDMAPVTDDPLILEAPKPAAKPSDSSSSGGAKGGDKAKPDSKPADAGNPDEPQQDRPPRGAPERPSEVPTRSDGLVPDPEG